MDYKTIKLKDGTEMDLFEGKIHSWSKPAIRHPKALKKLDEYYIYGFKKTKEEWKECKREFKGSSFTKESDLTRAKTGDV